MPSKKVTLSQNSVALTEKGVTLSQNSVALAEKGVTLSQNSVALAEKGVTSSQNCLALAEKGVILPEKKCRSLKKRCNCNKRSITLHEIRDSGEKIIMRR